jgi:hypothetical protein
MTTRRRLTAALVLPALCAITTAPLRAGEDLGSISDGAVTFTRTSFGGTPFASLTGVSSTGSNDFLASMGWWIRIDDSPNETPFPAPTGVLFSGDQSTITWDSVFDVGKISVFSAEEKVTVFDRSVELGHPGGYLLIQLHLQNLVDVNLTARIYHYADVDIVGPADDYAELIERTPNHLIEMSDGANFVQHIGAQKGYLPVNQIHHRVAAFGVLDTDLNDGGPDPFTDTGLPFGPGDVTSGYELDFEVAAAGEEGDSIDLVVLLGVNVSLNCSYYEGVFCDGFEGGSPGLWFVP